MANSVIKIKFNNPAQLFDRVNIFDDNSGVQIMSLYYTNDAFFDDGSGQGFSIPITGDITEDVNNAYNFIQNNYNVTNAYNVTRNYATNEIEIVDNIGNKIFSESSNNTNGRITTDITNLQDIPPITITNISVLENATDPCNLYDIEITTNVDSGNITRPVNQPITDFTSVITGVSRDSVDNLDITVSNESGFTNRVIYTPKIQEPNFDLRVISNLNNTSTLNIVYDLQANYSTDFSIEYSLDNVNFFNSTSFSNLEVGNYTLYIRDNIGCSLSIDFEVTEQELNVFQRVPIFNVSNSNGLISVRRSNGLKNPLNSLSYETETGVNRRDFVQLYEKTDGLLTQQFESSYENVTVTLVDCQGNENNILFEQKSNNSNITDVRDVTLTTVSYLDQSYVGVKYVSGNTYDPDTLAKNGEYFLGSLTPSFMDTGDGIILEGLGTFRVQDKVFKDNTQVLVLDILQFNFPIDITGQTIKGTTKYNQLDYELFEYSLDTSVLDGSYYIKYNATDSEFEDINEVTEWFNVSEKQDQTYLIEYYNSENNETNYSTGIRNKIRVPYDIELEYLPTDTQEVYNTDTNSVSIETTYRDSWKLYTESMPLQMVRKIGLAISNNRLFINGLSVNKSENIESEPITGSNLYKMVIQFISADYAYSSISQNGSIILPSGQPLNIGNEGNGLLFVN